PRSYRLAQTSDARRYEERLWWDLVVRSAAVLEQVAAYTQVPAAEWKKRLGEVRAAHPDEGEAASGDPFLRDNLFYLADSQSHAGLELFTALSAPQRYT